MNRLLLSLTLILSGLGAHAVEFSANRTYQDVTNVLHSIALKYPKTTQVINIGMSDSGVAIEGLQIGQGDVHNLLVATHHGNEYGSTELALGFADSMAQAPIPGQTMFVIPVLNVDGYNNRNRYERVNGRNIDPNRNYPGPCGTEGPFTLKSTSALAKFIDAQNIVASSTIHTYWPAVVYPWGISTHDVDTPYTSKYTELVQAATSVSHYQAGNNTQIIYPADGTFEDYAYWQHGIWSLLFEVGNSHNPNTSDIKKLVDVNVPGLRKFYEIAPTTRAPKHSFDGQCSAALRAMDLHIE